MKSENLDRLKEIQEEMLELRREAEKLLHKDGGSHYMRAKAYWLAQLKTSLTNEHEYLGGSMCSMQDTIEEIEGEE